MIRIARPTYHHHEELLAYSRNVGAAYVATTLGPTRLYEVMRRSLRLGEITGVDLALEAAGSCVCRATLNWHISDLGTNSYGQGISVTPLQVVAALWRPATTGVDAPPTS
jgi:cell division protein FtsI/penicillin-binding protein 2